MAERIHLMSIADVGRLVSAVGRFGFPCAVDLKRTRRSLPQNSLFHKWCGQIAEFFVSRGKTHFASGTAIDAASIKRNLKETFLGTEIIEHVNLKTGEITEREELRHTSHLDRGDMCAFMTLVDRWAMEHGIPLSHPEDSEYQQIMREMGEAA